MPSHLKTIEQMEVHRESRTMCNTETSKVISRDPVILRADKFLQIYMPLPPVDEQRAIVDYINEKTAKVESLITELQAEIDYLKEFKQRLIADCVTGKVNVQNL